MTDRRGLWAALLAYGIWGAFPLYFQLTKPAGSLEVVAHRVVWSMLILLLMLLAMKRLPAVRRWCTPDVLWRLALAAVLIGVNWLTYIWAVTNGHTLDASLGYFLNPLLSVALGVAFLGERLSPLQWVGVGAALLGALYLCVVSPQFPWVALVLAATFALYGWIKKKVRAPALEGMLIETSWLLLPALAVLAWLAGQQQLVFAHHTPGTDVALWGTGLATTIPLLAFGVAAQRLPLAMLGMMQYVAPTLQFLCGVLILQEPMDGHRLTGFVGVWIGLALFTLASVQRIRQQLRQSPV